MLHKPMHKPMPMHFHLRLLLSRFFLLLLHLKNKIKRKSHPRCPPMEEREEARKAKRVFVVTRTSPRPEENTLLGANHANDTLRMNISNISNISKIELHNENN